jgi:Domain of Unknown Function (DUF1080)
MRLAPGCLLPLSWLMFAAGCWLAVAGDLRAQADARAPSEDPDFRRQGEYEGKLTVEGRPDVSAGAQIVADGAGQFTAIVYLGGLPGAGWKPGDVSWRAEGKATDDHTDFQSDRLRGALVEEKLTLNTADGTLLGTLTKIERRSPTLGQKPPPGAVVLFDGTNVEQWIGGRLVADQSLACGTVSKQAFGDFSLHLEFRLPFSPTARGQQRGNSGVYLQNRYEIQVLDSFGLEGASNECGAIYRFRAPDVNMCFPPLTWQTYDIDFTASRFDAERNKIQNARVTVKQNGVTIHDKVELVGPTPAGLAKEYPGTGPLQLQWHMAPVAYRNIWVVDATPEEK